MGMLDIQEVREILVYLASQDFLDFQVKKHTDAQRIEQIPVDRERKRVKAIACYFSSLSLIGQKGEPIHTHTKGLPGPPGFKGLPGVPGNIGKQG